MKKIVNIIFSFVIFTTLLTGCVKDKTIVDRAGNEVVLPSEVNRIISAAPSITEVLIELGLSEKIVAVDSYSPLETLNNDVEVIDMMTPDAETMIGLEPDLILLSGINDEEQFQILKDSGIAVVSIPSAINFEELYKDIRFIGEIVGKKDIGNDIANQLNKEIDDIKEIASKITNKKTVYFEISPAPYLFTAGNNTFQHEIIKVIGATNIFEDQNNWFAPSEESIIEKNPDVIITNVNYIENATNEIMERTGWDVITAIQNNDVHLVDANASSRPSQHVIKAIREVAKAVYPEYYE